MHPSVNVLGTNLEPCSQDPLTGWYRDGCCNTDDNDHGSHTVCCVLNDDFLEFAQTWATISSRQHPASTSRA